MNVSYPSQPFSGVIYVVETKQNEKGCCTYLLMQSAGIPNIQNPNEANPPKVHQRTALEMVQFVSMRTISNNKESIIAHQHKKS